ncbi:ankyrin repeat domain-containing protein 63-like [Spea bombifrons]|uniref:ankyrin repeat domain-containing protein 63-like n=1 Tax=Spea bombifrons TaxID=233779 RepID=UPI00234AE558|nr:ankyrin repeat domain-containing protein 63-like [Spea bombifrons]
MLKVSGKPTREGNGTQALLDAMCNDQMHLARFILEALDGKIVNTRGGDLSRTPLICSTLLPEPRARQRYMLLLLEKGAEVNSRDRAGRTALSYSCERGHLPEVKILVQHGADPELADLWGNTALIYASVSGHAQVLDFLTRAFKRLGLQVDRANRVGNSALDVARYLGYRDCELTLSGCNWSRKKEEQDPLQGNWEEGQSGSRGAAHSILLGRSRSLASHRRMESMDSIEEEDGDKGGCAASSSSHGFSNVLNPRPRSWSLQYGGRTGERRELGLHLPALSSASIQISTSLYSPRPGKQHEPSICPLPGPLGILLTPLSANPHSGPPGGNDHQPGCSKETGFRRFNDTYYKKRSSLPSTLLSPTPPDRGLLGYQSKDSQPHGGPSNPFTVLGNKLLRRFTFPEFKKQQVSGGSREKVTLENTETGHRGMARSETFPVSKNHPKVVSKPSVDSISSVKCEFDFQQQTNS